MKSLTRAFFNKEVIIYILLPILTLSLTCTPLYADTNQSRILQFPLFQKGMSYATWTDDGFSDGGSDKSIESMAQAGVTAIAIVVTWYQDSASSTSMHPTERTVMDGGIKRAIRKAKKLGMTVMIKPHLDIENSEDSWRGDIGFQKDEEWLEWFKNYARFVCRYARIAEKEGAELFCIGTELQFAATRAKMWKEIVIPEVRKYFTGHITYAANWDDYSEIKFWDELDYIGIDAYFPLSKKNKATYDEIIKSWQNWVAEIEGFQKQLNKPVIFTECGYSSADSAAMKPWEEAVGGEPNLQAQADCYRALLETCWDKPWFCGAYWWGWNTTAKVSNPNNWHFTPQGKPALEHVKTWYAKSVDRKIAFASAPKLLELESPVSEQLLSPAQGYRSDRALDVKAIRALVR